MSLGSRPDEEGYALRDMTACTLGDRSEAFRSVGRERAHVVEHVLGEGNNDGIGERSAFLGMEFLLGTANNLREVGFQLNGVFGGGCAPRLG